ncbi:MAG TPA: HAMP domain-containing histidine kinase [Pseudoclavibacter sp.]|nr:HAMP domain-containing histidine kinase [Pseudoclavibacter sp.]
MWAQHHRRRHSWFWQETSLQTRITTLTIALISGGLLVSGLGTHVMLTNYLYEQIDQQLSSTASILAESNLSELQSINRALPTEYYAVYFSDSTLVKLDPGIGDTESIPDISALENALDQRADNQPYTLTGGSETLWRFINVQISPSVSLVVGIPITSVTKTLAQYTNIFIGFGLIVLLSGGVSAWLLAGSLFAPLRRAEDAAETIASGDYTKRLSEASTNTEIGRLNHSLNVMTDRIEASFAERARTIDQMRRFVSDASHELRTPLVSVRGYAELYRMGALSTPDDVAQAMDRIEREAIRMSGLVEDLLALARLDEARPLQSEVVDMRLVAHDIALDAMARDHDREISLVDWTPPAVEQPQPEPPEPVIETTGKTSRSLRRIVRRSDRAAKTAAIPTLPTLHAPDSPETVAPLVWGEENKLRQVLTNITVNALRYTPEGSPLDIAVGADPHAGIVVVEIRDHGEGIPEQLRDKIFQRFFRADNSRTRDTGGSGLGLAIVAAIITAHHGTVVADDTPGGGATFRITLPLYRYRADSAEADPTLPASAPDGH